MLKNILSPKSIAVIGASKTPGKLGFEILSNLVHLGYTGKVYPINPKAKEILGLPVYSNVKRVKDPIDIAVIAIPGKYVKEALIECGKKKIKGVIIISAGFKEVGTDEGIALENDIAKIAKKYNIRVIGPNCLGILNTSLNMNASFAEGLPKKGGISLISQSGAMAVAITDWAYQANIGFQHIISVGNKMDVNENDILEYFEKDPKTKVIVLYLESIADGKRFMEITKRIGKKKPIIVVKAGTSEEGSKAIMSHTGSLAGSNKAIEAAFEQCGIIRATSIEDMFDLARGLSCQAIPKGNRIAIVTNAGGPGVLSTDSLDGTDIVLATFSKQTTQGLQAVLPAAANIHNPVDIIGDALADRYQNSLEIIAQDPDVDMILVLLTPQIMTEKEKTANIIIDIQQKYPEKTIITSFLGGKNVDYAISRLQDHNIPNYFPERGIGVLDSMVKYALWKKMHSRKVRVSENVHAKNLRKKIQKEIRLGKTQISPELTSEILHAYNIHDPDIALAKNVKSGVKLAQKIGYPVVLKIASPDILHKTDAGGVRVGIENNEDFCTAYSSILQDVKSNCPKAKIQGILVQKMETFGKEVILGMKRDPVFGPLLMFGLGGIYIEVMKDVSFRIAPIAKSDAEEMLEEVKSIQLLKGVRGEAPSDMKNIIETLLSLSQMVIDLPEIEELDINPLLVHPEGEGVVAVDTRFLLK